MSKHRFLVFLGLIITPWETLAQEPASTPGPDVPSPPFVARAPEFAAWTVDVTHKRAASTEPSPTPMPVVGAKGKPPSAQAPGKALRTSVVVKTGDILRDVRAYTDGTRSENWWVHGRILRQDPEEGYINVIDPGMDQSAPQLNASDFEALGWINLSHFARVENKRGVPCYVYEWKERMPTGADFDKIQDYAAKSALYQKFKGKPTSYTRVWIAKEARLPVVSEDENASYVYNFLKPPTDPLKLPPDFQKVWDRYQGTLDDWKVHVMSRQK